MHEIFVPDNIDWVFLIVNKLLDDGVEEPLHLAHCVLDPVMPPFRIVLQVVVVDLGAVTACLK